LATEVDRTIFFDFLPVTAYRIRDFKVRLQLYTVPGQVFYNATRKLVLNGVDGIVFVADSQRAMRDSNLESLQNLEENLMELGLEPEQVPTILQLNKRDLADIDTVEQMDQLYNPRRLPVFATVATTGEGLFEALRAISQMVVTNLMQKGLGRELHGGEATGSAAAPVQQQPAPQDARSAPASTIGSIAQAATAAASSQAPQATHGLWPSGALAEYGRRLDESLHAANWAAVALAAEALVHQAASRWAQASGNTSPDPTPTFLLMRGVSSERYRAFHEALWAARKGDALDQSSAMNAVVIALQSVW
jgi:signal recognition particle receptor subunit beta